MTKIETVLAGKLADSTLTQKLFNLYQDYREDPVAVTVLTNIQKYLPELTGYRGIPRSPVTSNMIEGLNSHLETRLFGLRSFQSVTHARLWFNGYVLKRRLTKFTDCRGKFRSLNGKCGAELTKKPEVDIPRLFNSQVPFLIRYSGGGDRTRTCKSLRPPVFKTGSLTIRSTPPWLAK